MQIYFKFFKTMGRDTLVRVGVQQVKARYIPLQGKQDKINLTSSLDLFSLSRTGISKSFYYLPSVISCGV